MSAADPRYGLIRAAIEADALYIDRALARAAIDKQCRDAADASDKAKNALAKQMAPGEALTIADGKGRLVTARTVNDGRSTRVVLSRSEPIRTKAAA